MLAWYYTVLIGIVLCLAGVLGGYSYRKSVQEKKIGRTEEYAKKLLDDATRRADEQKKEMILVAKEEVLHLKTGVNYIENNKMLVSGEFIDKPDFASYEKIIVPEEEAYGANCIWMNGTVIVPEGYDAVKKAVEDAGYPVILVDTSEFRKIDGGLSCLSLRF